MVILGSTDLEQKAWFPGNWDVSNEIVECFAITQIWSQLSRVKWSMFYYTLDTYIFKFSFNANQIICDCIYVPENRGEHKGFIVFTEKEHSLNLVLSYILLILYTVDLGFSHCDKIILGQHLMWWHRWWLVAGYWQRQNSSMLETWKN